MLYKQVRTSKNKLEVYLLGLSLAASLFDRQAYKIGRTYFFQYLSISGKNFISTQPKWHHPSNFPKLRLGYNLALQHYENVENMAKVEST